MREIKNLVIPGYRIHIESDIYITGYGGATISFCNQVQNPGEAIIEIDIGPKCRLHRFDFYGFPDYTPRTFDPEFARCDANLFLSKDGVFIFAKCCYFFIHKRNIRWTRGFGTLPCSIPPIATDSVIYLIDLVERNLDFVEPRAIVARHTNTIEVLIYEPVKPKFVRFFVEPAGGHLGNELVNLEIQNFRQLLLHIISQEKQDLCYSVKLML
jgi:hypothetical protein